MAKKLVLVPEDMYKNMLSSTRDEGKSSFDDVIPASKGSNLDFTKHEVRKQLKGPKNVRERREKYTQVLRRYLKMRKEKLQRPVKLQLPDQSKLVLNPQTGEITGLDEFDDLEDTFGSVGSTFGTPKRKSTPASTLKLTTPLATGRSRRKGSNKKENQQAINDRIRDFVTYMIDNPAKFGVTSDGYILNNQGKVIQVWLKLLGG